MPATPAPTGDALLRIEVQDRIGRLTMTRPDKRNALNDGLIAAFGRFFAAPPEGLRAVVLTGEGDHFSAGLDLSEHVTRAPAEVMGHSRNWHQVMDLIQFGGLPVVAALKGAVIGGGLELATSTHVRVAEPSTFYQLPEGRRGIFVGGGGSVRVAKIIGTDRMVEMMLTARTYSADEGLAMGLAHHAAGAGAAEARALELAGQIAANAPLSNYLAIQALGRIQDMAKADGLFTESLAAALSQTGADAEEGLKAFLEKRKPKFS